MRRNERTYRFRENEGVQYLPPVYMPDGKPAPYMMTFDDLIEFLRINVEYPRNTIKRLKDDGLTGVRISKKILYPLPVVLDFVHHKHRRKPA